MKYLNVVLQAVLGLVLAGSLLGISVATATPFADRTSSDPPTLITHLRTELASNDAVRIQNALVDVIALAGCTGTCTVGLRSVEDKHIRIDNEAGVGSAIDLSALAPDVLEAYRSGPADGHRLLALSALINLGNDEVLEQLVNEGESPSNRQSDRVKKTTQRSLAHFYLTKYPELRDRAGQKGTVSIQEVKRAEAVRVKVARKAAKMAKTNENG